MNCLAVHQMACTEEWKAGDLWPLPQLPSLAPLGRHVTIHVPGRKLKVDLDVLNAALAR
jgi:hypothetical protein